MNQLQLGLADFASTVHRQRLAPVQGHLDDAGARAQPVGRPRYDGLESLRQGRAPYRLENFAADALVVNAAEVGLSVIETVLDFNRVRYAVLEIVAKLDGLHKALPVVADTQHDALGRAADDRACRSRRTLAFFACVPCPS